MFDLSEIKEKFKFLNEIALFITLIYCILNPPTASLIALMYYAPLTPDGCYYYGVRMSDSQ